jgi:hypothetical protein
MHEQDDWCRASQETSVRFNTAFPEDLSLESLIALLRGDVLLNVHCYETHDIEAMVRHSLEFNFTISAFHHALDAYRIPDILRRARNNITIATFADHWGYKKEAFQAIPQAPKMLYDAGIPVALKSDHPVLNSQHLVFEAAKSSHYGLPPQEAFKAVTSIPANAIGLGHRVGSLKVGYDADIVIWDREPLELGATPLQVFIDGVPQFEERDITPVPAKKVSTKNSGKKNTAIDISKGAKNYVLKNAGYSFLESEPAMGPLELVIKDGAVVCSAADCSNSIISVQTNGEELPVYDLEGGYVLPVSRGGRGEEDEEREKLVINLVFILLDYRVLLVLDLLLVLSKLKPKMSRVMVLADLVIHTMLKISSKQSMASNLVHVIWKRHIRAAF